jgi:cytoskeletal protein RodZ
MKKQWIILTVILVAAAIVITFFVTKYSMQEASTPQASESTTSASGNPSASASESADSSELPLPTGTKTVTSYAPATPSPDATELNGEDPIEYTDNTIEYEYYDISSDSTKTEKETVDEDSGTLETALDIVAQQFFSESLEDSPIAPNSITLQGGNLYIDFTEDIYNTNFGSTAENSLLDSIAAAYLDNTEDITAVYYSVDGKDYESGHIGVPKDIPYQTK